MTLSRPWGRRIRPRAVQPLDYRTVVGEAFTAYGMVSGDKSAEDAFTDTGFGRLNEVALNYFPSAENFRRRAVAAKTHGEMDLSESYWFRCQLAVAGMVTEASRHHIWRRHQAHAFAEWYVATLLMMGFGWLRSEDFVRTLTARLTQVSAGMSDDELRSTKAEIAVLSAQHFNHI